MENNNTRWNEFNSIVDTLNLDIKEKGLLLVLFRHVNYKTGYADPSRALIKMKTNISDNRTLDKLMDSLIEKGFIVRESGKGIRSKYFIKVGGKLTPSVNNTLSGEITLGVGGEITPQKEKKRKTKENNIYIDLTFIDDVIDRVKLTQEQYDKLVDKFGKYVVNNQILHLDSYIVNGKGSRYKDHYRVLNTWCNKNTSKSIESKSIDDVINKYC